MKQIILALMLAVAGIGAAVAANPIREGNMISGHVLVKGSEENIRKPPVIHVFSATPSISIFVPKNEIYDDTRRSCRNYYVLQGIQSNL